MDIGRIFKDAATAYSPFSLAGYAIAGGGITALAGGSLTTAFLVASGAVAVPVGFMVGVLFYDEAKQLLKDTKENFIDRHPTLRKAVDARRTRLEGLDNYYR